jgi:pimeloyl-ACP methyl ester carboxylesterase
VPVGGASLYVRDGGRGRPLIVLHGGPDFDQAYLRPELDELADTYRLIFIPPTIASAIAEALPNATLVTIADCGHFADLECGTAVRTALNNVFAPGKAQ